MKVKQQDYYYITTTNKSTTPSQCVFFDSESLVNIEITDEELQKVIKGEKVEKKHDPYLICASFSSRNKEHVFISTKKEYSSLSATDFKRAFWEDVDLFTKVKSKTWIFAHNAKYDTLVTGGVKNLVELGYRVEAFSDDNPFFLILNQKKCPECKSHNIDDNEDFFICENCGLLFYKKFVRTKSIVLLSSTNYYQFSLAKLAKCFNMKKGDYDHTLGLTDEAIKYCHQDVKILETAMISFINFVKEEQLGVFKITAAGQAFSAYRARFLKEDTIQIQRKIEVIKVERAAYAGGRNEVWKRGKFGDKKLFYVDINSMYPFVMSINKYPVKFKTIRKKCSIDQLKSFIKQGFQVCARCELKTTERVYFKNEERLLFPVGEFETVLSTPEIEYAIKNKHLQKVTDVCVYENENIFESYINYFYTKRLEARDNKDEVRTLLYKLLMNVLYGKFGQKNYNWEKIGVADPTVIRTEHVRMCGGKSETYKTFGGGVFVRRKLPDGEAESGNSFPAIAAHVTAYARMELWKCIEIAGKETVYYMDTDSLILDEVGFDRLKKKGLIDDKKLGALKLEHEIFDVDIRGCKDYAFSYFAEKDNDELGIKKGDIIKEDKIKGVNKNAMKISEGKYIVSIWRGFSKYINKGVLDGYENDVIIKELARNYTKGIITQGGEVKPFTYEKNKNVVYEQNSKIIVDLGILVDAYKVLYKNEKETDQKLEYKKEIKKINDEIKRLKDKKQYTGD